MATYDFNFNIVDVAGPKVLDLTFRGDANKMQATADCPFCFHQNGKKGKLSINTSRNQFRCHICGKSGGMLALYADYHGISTVDANREIKDLLGIEGFDGDDKKTSRHIHSKAAPETPVVSKANAADIHQTYTLLLCNLKLAAPHRMQLLNRGLSEERIDANGYRSVPPNRQELLCETLLRSGCVLEGVPGFYKTEKGTWSVKLKASGIMIPVRSLDGRIVAIQQRMDKPMGSNKYIWLSSSGLPGGTSSGAPSHFVGNPEAKRIFITEGPLKGDVAHALSGKTFVCIPGANALNGLDSVLTEIKELGGCAEIVETLDMDKVMTTPGVPIKNQDVYIAALKESGDCEPLIEALGKPWPVNFTGEQGKLHFESANKALHDVADADLFREALNMHRFNPFVSTAVDKLKERVESHGFTVKSAYWKDKSLKGVDDYYLWRTQEKQSMSYEVEGRA